MCSSSKYNPWNCGQIKPLKPNKCRGIRCGAYICYPISCVNQCGNTNCNCGNKCGGNIGCGCGCEPWNDGIDNDPYWNWFDSRTCRK